MNSLAWLFARQRFGIKPGLERVARLLTLLGDPQDALTCILVTGTNGKGSTSATLASILKAAGFKTSLFTSPHLSQFGERFLVDGQQLSAAYLEATLARVRPHAEKAEATFFEIVTALALLLFAEAGAKYAVLECGMGGQNDATNVVEPELSLVINVSLEHTRVLGSTVAEIAQDKAGVMRPAKPCLSTARGEALGVLKRHAARIGAVFTEVRPEQVRPLGWEGVRFLLDGLELHSPLIGSFQADNAALAAAAAFTLGVSPEAVRAGVANTVWPGRLEQLSYKGKTVLLDGAHNPAAANVLATTLRALPFERLHLVFGASADKPVDKLLAPLAPLAGSLYLTTAALNARALGAEALAELGVGEVVGHAPSALETAVANAGKDDLVLVAGSLYLVGELRAYLLDETGEGLKRWQ